MYLRVEMGFGRRKPKAKGLICTSETEYKYDPGMEAARRQWPTELSREEALRDLTVKPSVDTGALLTDPTTVSHARAIIGEVQLAEKHLEMVVGIPERWRRSEPPHPSDTPEILASALRQARQFIEELLQ